MNHRARWGLTWRGWLLFLLVICSAAVGILLALHPFLAITDRQETDILVVEGWIHDYAIHAAVAEFKAHGYQRVFSTGGPVSGSGGYTNDFNTSASVGADRLKAFGLPENVVQ